MKTTPDWNAIRKEFPTLANWTYLDVARKTAAPRCQERAMQDYSRDVYENAGTDAWSALNVAKTRTIMAELLGAKPAEIAFTKNTTEGLNIAAHGFDLKPGDNVVLTNMEHMANVWVWKHWEKKGVELRFAQHRNWRLPVEAFVEKMDARTRVVSTAYVTYSNGYRVNLPELGRICRERNVRLVVDGVQAAGLIAAPLSSLGADIVAIGGHKGLFGLTGSGIVYCREELVNQLKADFLKEPESAPKAAAHANSQFDYVRTAHRFEGGNPNFLGLKVFRYGAEFLNSIGIANIEARVRELTTECMKLVKDAGLTTHTPSEWEERAQIINVPVQDAEAVMDRLREKHRVIVNVKDGALRLSMSFNNNEEDIERTVDAIRQEVGGKPARARAAAGAK
ncbi:MAG TPA: aminotransferase class V-fold PLP-dependent enzyme [Burkholderiales bacterium]|nr:aminotransferase class V-fold PLP-dependent enzyme [Burkholderiales bacterium]